MSAKLLTKFDKVGCTKKHAIVKFCYWPTFASNRTITMPGLFIYVPGAPRARLPPAPRARRPRGPGVAEARGPPPLRGADGGPAPRGPHCAGAP